MFLQYAYLTKEEELYQQAITNYEFAISIEPQNYKAIANYATALKELAALKQDISLYNQSIAKFDQALKLQPNDHSLINIYAWGIIEYVKLQPDVSYANHIVNLLEQTATDLSDNLEILETLISALLIFYKIFNENNFLVKAEKVLIAFYALTPHKTYNHACYYSLTNDIEKCKTMLLNAETHNTLPSNPYEHLLSDTDLDNARDELWFIELLERLKEKEETTKKAS